MELFTVTMSESNNLLSVPLNHVQGLGQATNGKDGFITVNGTDVLTKEDYPTLVDMWRDLTE
jgi:hypothetical protein